MTELAVVYCIGGLLLIVSIGFVVFLLTKIIVSVTEAILEWRYNREKRKRRGK